MDRLSQIKLILEGYQEIDLVIVFGSVLHKKRFNKDSDIDIAVAGKKVFPANFLVKLNIELSEKLNHEIDIVDLNKNSGVILQQVLCHGKKLICRDTTLYAELIKKMWYNQADVMPNIRMIWKHRRDKLLGNKNG